MIWWIGPLPWLVPGCVLALVVSTVASGRAARWLRASRPAAWVILMSMGVFLAGTLTPVNVESRLAFPPAGSCDLSRMGLASPDDLLRLGDTIGNILGLIPLGFAIALIPRSPRKAAVLLVAVALPFAVEAAQLVVVALHRACESADVVDNLTGLVFGLASGAGARWTASRRGRAP